MPAPQLWTRQFVTAILTHLSFALGFMLSVHFPGFLKQLGAGEFLIGNVVALSALVSMMLGPWVGPWLDRRGRRGGLMAGLAMYGLVSALYSTVSAVGPWLYCLRVLDGGAAVVVYAALFTVAADLVPSERRTEGLAIFGAAGLLAIGISAEVGGWMLAWAGFGALFVCASALSLLSMLLAWRLSDVAPVSGDEATTGFWSTARQPDLGPVWVSALVFFVSMASVFTFMKTFVMGLPFADIGTFFTVYSGVAVSLRLFAGWLPDRVGPARMLGPALGCYGLGLSLLVDVQSQATLLLAGGLCGVGHGYTFPILLSLAVTRARPDARGTAAGIYATIDSLGHLVGGPALGLVIERAGYATAFSTVATAVGCAVVGFHFWDRQVSARPEDRTARPSMAP